MSPPLLRTSRGHTISTDAQGNVILVPAGGRRALILTTDDLWAMALRLIGEQEMVHRLNATEVEQAERYKRDSYLWEKRRTRRGP